METHQSIFTFYLVGILICTGFSVLLVIGLRLKGLKIHRYLYMALFLLIMSWDNIYTILALQFYGRQDSGERIYRVVQNVDGYYDEGNTYGGDKLIEDRLFNKEFQFVEINVTSSTLKYPGQYPQQKGLYRFYLAEKDSPLCEPYYKTYENFPKIKEAVYCVATEKISALKSRYSYHHYGYEAVAPLIKKDVAIVKDMQTGEELARATTYLRGGGWLLYQYGAGPRAHLPTDTSIKYTILDKALRSNIAPKEVYADWAASIKNDPGKENPYKWSFTAQKFMWDEASNFINRGDTNMSLKTFAIIGYLMCFAFSALIIFWFRRKGIKRSRYLYVALFLLIMSWDNIYAILALQYYGLKDGGEHIYQVVHNVDGYFDEGNTWGNIGIEKLSKYRFVECDVTTPDGDRYPRESGLYRFYLAERDAPLCKLFYESYERSVDYPKIRNAAHCVATEKISALKSKYSYHYYDYEKVAPFILKETAVVKNMETSEELARATVYRRYGGFLYYLLNGQMTQHSLFPTEWPDENTMIIYKLVEKILQPNKEK